MAATPILSFLYPARIVQRPIRAPVVRQFLRSLHNTRSLNSRRSRGTDPIPFELPPDIDKRLLPQGENGEDPSPEDMGTITPLEKDVFRRIFKQIEKTTKQKEYEEQRQKLQELEEAGRAANQASKVTTKKTADRVNTIIGEVSGGMEEAERVKRREEVRQRKAEVAFEAVFARKADEAADRLAMTLDQQRHAALRKFPKSLRTAAGQAMGVQEKKEPKRAKGVPLPVEPIMVEDEAIAAQTEAIKKTAAAMRQLREERQRKMELMMLSRKSDFALWEYMQKHVFTLVDELELDAKRKKKKVTQKKELEEKAKPGGKKAKPLVEKRAAAPAPAKAQQTSRKEEEEAWDREEEEDEEEDEVESEQVYAQESGGPGKREEELTTVLKLAGKRPSKGRLAEVALKTYGPMYPSLLLHGLKLFGQHYDGGKTSPFVRAVLPEIKAYGLASYVLGASTPFYNELLRLEWTRFGDMDRVWALLAEMRRAGLAYDRGTLAVLQSMEFYVLPVFRGGSVGNLGGARGHASAANGSGRSTGISESNNAIGKIGQERNLFVETALRQLPDFQGFPQGLAYWKQQVERGVLLNEPRW